MHDTGFRQLSLDTTKKNAFLLAVLLGLGPVALAQPGNTGPTPQTPAAPTESVFSQTVVA